MHTNPRGKKKSFWHYSSPFFKIYAISDVFAWITSVVKRIKPSLFCTALAFPNNHIQRSELYCINYYIGMNGKLNKNIKNRKQMVLEGKGIRPSSYSIHGMQIYHYNMVHVAVNMHMKLSDFSFFCLSSHYFWNWFLRRYF